MKVGERIWFAKRITEKNAEISNYEAPQPIITRFNYFTVMPATSRGFSEVMRYGEDAENTWTAIANAKAFGSKRGFIIGLSRLGSSDILSDVDVIEKIKVGDLFWLDGERPVSCIENEYGNGASATAVVKSVDYVNYTMHITLTRNKDKVEQ